MSKSALPTTVMIGRLVTFSFLAELVWKGSRVPVQLKTVLRISHHCGFDGSSQTTIPSLLNEFLKEHKAFLEEHRTVEELKQEVATLTAGLQKVSAQLELSKSARQTVLNNH